MKLTQYKGIYVPVAMGIAIDLLFTFSFYWS